MQQKYKEEKHSCNAWMKSVVSFATTGNFEQTRIQLKTRSNKKELHGTLDGFFSEK